MNINHSNPSLNRKFYKVKQTILVAGGTGHLGGKIIHALVKSGADVRMVVRGSSDAGRLSTFKALGVKLFKADLTNAEKLTDACNGVTCMISALAGLRDVVVDSQKILLEAAIAAGVTRFIPSDYSINFTHLPPGENRNFDLRREFHKILEIASIDSTSIFNGAFADILTYNIPILDFKRKIVCYWGDDSDWKMDFTTMDDTASFTAAVALDTATPRYLNIASFQISPKELSEITGQLTGEPFKLVPLGSLEQFAEKNKADRAANPEGENDLYPKWQNGQYMHDMFSTHNKKLDNNRYPDLQWTSAKQFLQPILSRSRS